MAATYEPIQTYTLASAAASITFSSIAASWTDLRLVFAVHPTAASSVSICYRFNGDTASNYSDTLIKGNGASASSSRHTSQTYLYTAYGSIAAAAGYALVTTDIFSYAGSTFALYGIKG